MNKVFVLTGLMMVFPAIGFHGQGQNFRQPSDAFSKRISGMTRASKIDTMNSASRSTNPCPRVVEAVIKPIPLAKKEPMLRALPSPEIFQAVTCPIPLATESNGVQLGR